MTTHLILSLHLHAGRYAEALRAITEWAVAAKPAYVCFANVHMAVEAHQQPQFAHQVNQASLVLPDGMPLVKSLAWLYRCSSDRIAGMDMLPSILAECATHQLPVAFYGGSDQVLAQIQERIKIELPSLPVAAALSPPFRPLTPAEESAYAAQLADSGARVVLVSLGCPKQEAWMARHSAHIPAVLLGVGGAFSVYAGLQSRAPAWMRNASLEWLYRLGQEPRRLFQRYLITNTLFLWLLVKQWWRQGRKLAVTK